MTAPRSGADPASVRGLAVLAVAVVLGFLLLGGSDELNISTTSRSGPDATTTSITVTTVTEQAPTTGPAADQGPAKPPAEVKVIVLNGSGGVAKGVAGTSTEKLKELGYQTADPANATAEETTVVYFADGFEGNAQAIKTALKLSGTVAPLGDLEGGDVQDANVVVVLGADAAALVEGGADDGSTTTTTQG